MIGFEHEAVARLIGMPADHCIGPMVATGQRTKNVCPDRASSRSSRS